MHAFELNKHGKLVFPANCFPDLDFSTMENLEQLTAVIQRDFDAKAPTGTDIVERIKTGSYQSKFELMRDMALNLFWANRFKITMYDVLPTRWADVPRHRDDVSRRSRRRGRIAKPRSPRCSLPIPTCPRSGMTRLRTVFSRSSSTCSAIAAITRPNCPPSCRRLPNCFLTQATRPSA